MVRIPCLTVENPNRNVPDLYFKVVDPKLQVADLKAEVGELRSGGIPQFNPCIVQLYANFAKLKIFFWFSAKRTTANKTHDGHLWLEGE